MTDRSTPQTPAAEQHPCIRNPMVVIEGQDGSGVPGAVSRQEAAPPPAPALAPAVGSIPSEAPQPPSGRQHAPRDTTAPAAGGLHMVAPHWTDIPPPGASAFNSAMGGNLPSPRGPSSAVAVPSGVVASTAAASLTDEALLEPSHAVLQNAAPQSHRIAAPPARASLVPAPKKRPIRSCVCISAIAAGEGRRSFPDTEYTSRQQRPRW